MSKVRPAQASPAAQPQFKFRSQQTIFHHLFKAEIAKFLKDLSFGQESMRIDEIAHVHHFHNVNSMGHAQKYTTTVGGHFHEVTWTVDPTTGYPVAKCGPAMKKLTKNTPRGSKTTVEPMKFYNKDHDQWVADNHTHDMTYLGTDELSTATVQQTQQKNAEMIASMTPKATAEASISDSDRGE